jgi:hypothetical protein
MRDLIIEKTDHLWIFDRIKHKWLDAAHNELKPNDIFMVFEQNWKTFCDHIGEYVLYCKTVHLEDTGRTIKYTPLRNQLSFLAPDERDNILADKIIWI